MARPYRMIGENICYHITSRGNGRQNIYINDRDYYKFLEYVMNAKKKFNFYFYAYVLMNNHYHFLLETAQANLPQIMHYINTSYTVYFNVKRGKSGHLFQGRYKSLVVDRDNYFMELTRYIHRNPVRAQMVEKPEDYRWSSCREYLTKKSSSGYIDKDMVEHYFALDPEKYAWFVSADDEDPKRLFKDVYAGFILGEPKFIKKTLKELYIQVEGGDMSYHSSMSPVDSEDIVDAVAEYYETTSEELYAAKKRPILAKKVAIYLAKRLTGLSNKEIGAQFGISYSAVSKAASSIENELPDNDDVKDSVEELISHFKG